MLSAQAAAGRFRSELSFATALIFGIWLAISWDSPFLAGKIPSETHNKTDQCAQHEGRATPCTVTIEALGFIRDEHKSIFDGIIAFGTLALSFFTWKLWGSTDGLLRHAPQVERAYISGGGPADVLTESQPVKFTRDRGIHIRDQRVIGGEFHLSVNNYGKTPGELLFAEYGFCDAAGLVPAAPAYTMRHDFFDWVGPGERGREIGIIPIPAGMLSPAIFGRFHYRDIFKSAHFSSFILEINPWGTAPILAPPEYTESN